MRWYRWTVVVVGHETGNRTRMGFVRFRHEHRAQEWCRRLNAEGNLVGVDLTHWEPERI